MTLWEDAQAVQADLMQLRRALHREPEIGSNLPLTQAKVLAALDGLPLEITTGAALSSVTAVLRGGPPGPAVLLRSDMDALPVKELTGEPFASQSTARCTPAGTTCTWQSWSAPRGCCRQAATSCPAAWSSCSSQPRRARRRRADDPRGRARRRRQPSDRRLRAARQIGP